MTTEREYPQDEKTILLDRQGRRPAQDPITDFASAPRVEQLEERMMYAAGLHGAQNFNVGLNPLVTAAWELLSEVVQLKRRPAQESLRTLNDRLSSAVALFEKRARHDGVQSSDVLAGRYVLCSVVDEAVVMTSWGSQGDWSKSSLLSSFHGETFGGEKFFQLLDRLSRDPVKHLATLELMYLCLSLGFEGKYRVMERGLLQLAGVRDALFRQIRHVRGDSPQAPSPLPAPGLAQRKRVRIVPASGVAVCVVVCLVIMYSSLSRELSKQREAALQPYHVSAPATLRLRSYE